MFSSASADTSGLRDAFVPGCGQQGLVFTRFGCGPSTDSLGFVREGRTSVGGRANTRRWSLLIGSPVAARLQHGAGSSPKMKQKNVSISVAYMARREGLEPPSQPIPF